MPTTAYSLDELRAAVERAGERMDAVSQWSVGMHIGHVCLATISVGKALRKSQGPPPPARRPWGTRLMFLTGRIPRGKAQAPPMAIPRDEPDEERLRALLDEAERAIEAMQAMDSDRWFEHFDLGVLRRDAALRFVAIHHRHHARLIAEISSKAPGRAVDSRVG